MQIFGVTLTALQLFSVAFQLLSATAAALKLYESLKAEGVTPQLALDQASALWAKAICEIAARKAGGPIPHPMSDEERDRFYARVDGAA
jgi:hypothetical protein